MKKKSRRWLIASTIILATITTVSLMSVGQNSVYFYTPEEAKEQAVKLHGRDIKVGGMVKLGSKVWDREKLDLKFTLTNLKGAEIAVDHHGTPPDLFKENSGVVAEGRITQDGESFIATKLMVKHSEEYKKPDGHPSLEPALVEKSMFKEAAR